MAYFTVSLKIKSHLKAQDRDEAAEAFFSELQELYEAGELDGKLIISKASKNRFDEEEEEDEDEEEE